MEQIKVPTGEALFAERLPNGLMVFVLPKTGFLRKYAVLSTNYGSLDSKFRVPDEGVIKVPAGIAHFLEHKLFEEEDGNAFDRFAQFGASANAFTSYTQTSYLFSTVENWKEALAYLITFVNNPYLTEENVEKEKGIIEQEIRMYQDHPDRKLHSNLLTNLYHNNPLRIDIGGTVESVNAITVDLLWKCYNTFYQPSNMALFVVGDVDVDECFRIVRDNYRNWNQPNEDFIERFYPPEPETVLNHWVEDHLDISRPRYLLGFKNKPQWEGLDLLRQQITMGIVWRLIVGRSSQIYEELYNKNLVNDSFGASFSSSPQYAYSVVGSETDHPEKLHEELTQIITKLQKQSISETDVERLKRQMYGGHVAAFDSLEYVANRYISHYFAETPFHKFLPTLQSITAEDVSQALNDSLDLEYSTVSILWPARENNG